MFENSLRKWEQLGNEIGMTRSLTGIGAILRVTGHEKEALDVFQENLKLLRKHHQWKGIMTNLNHLALLHSAKGHWNEALIHYEEALQLAQEHGDEAFVAGMIHNMGQVYHDKGDYQKALECYQEALEMRRKQGDEWGMADSLNDIALIHQLRGNFSEAYELHQEALRIRKKLKLKRDVANSLLNLGQLHRLRGELNEATLLVTESLRMREQQGNVLEIAETLRELGLIHWRKGEGRQAIAYLRRSLEIYRRHGSPVETANNYYYLITVVLSLKLDNFQEMVHEWLKKLDNLRRVEQNPIIHEKFLFCKALMLKNSDYFYSDKSMKSLGKVLVNRTRSLKIFNRIRNSSNPKDFEVLLYSLMNLLDLLLVEYRLSSNKDHFEKFTVILEELDHFALKNGFTILQVELKWLRAILLFSHHDNALAMKTFDQAIQEARENGLNFLENLLENERKRLENMTLRSLSSDSDRFGITNNEFLSELARLLKILINRQQFNHLTLGQRKIMELSDEERKEVLSMLRKKIKSPYFSAKGS